jgi:AcrR family transcriptional regulator
VGHANATTRLIAESAGVAEGTIYRHFSDKVELLFAAAMNGNEAILELLAALPERAGTGSIASNLSEALVRLVELRRDLLPLELALRTDPEMIRRRSTLEFPADSALLLPPNAIATYLEREQECGRVRRDLDTTATAMLILAALFGLALSVVESPDDVTNDCPEAVRDQIHTFMELITRGMNP